jgi:hypothetical protein
MPAGVAPFLSSWRQPCFAGFVSRSASVNRVRWDYLDEQGRSVQQDSYRYVLRLEEGAGPQICVVIAPPSI